MKTKLNKSIWLITIVCIVLGYFLNNAFHGKSSGVEIGQVASVKTVERLLAQKKNLEEKKNELDKRIADIEGQVAKYEDIAAQNDAQLQAIKNDLQNARMMAGLSPVEGPGIEIILNDRKRDTILTNNPGIMKYYIVHDSDLLNVINELREAGAEAIAINDTRIMATSRISCGGPTISIGKYERFAPPFIIHAIGDPDALIASFQREDSIYQDLIAWGLEFQIRKLDKVEIPRYLGDTEYTFSKAIQGGE